MIRRTALLASAAVLIGSGVIMASPVAAYAQSSCTGSSSELISESSGDGVTAIPSIGNGTGRINCDLGPGNQSQAVSTLQYSLNKCYGSGLAVDGIYGSLTAAAVRHVQSINSITPDGVYGPQTRGVMKWRDTSDISCGKLK